MWELSVSCQSTWALARAMVLSRCCLSPSKTIQTQMDPINQTPSMGHWSLTTVPAMSYSLIFASSLTFLMNGIIIRCYSKRLEWGTVQLINIEHHLLLSLIKTWQSWLHVYMRSTWFVCVPRFHMPTCQFVTRGTTK